MLGAASRPMRVRIRVESLKIVGRSLAWVNGTYNRADGLRWLSFKGAEHLAALRDDALASTQAELTIEATVTPGVDENTLVAIEYHGRISDATHDLEQDMHAVVVKSGKRSCEMHWSVRGEQWCEDQPKSERHNVFATWLVHTFGAECLRKGAGVVDVAGGSGHLAAALRSRTDALVTVIDPLEDFENADGTRWNDGPTLPAPTILLRERFDADFVERDAVRRHLFYRAALCYAACTQTKRPRRASTQPWPLASRSRSCLAAHSTCSFRTVDAGMVTACVCINHLWTTCKRKMIA